MARTRQSAYQWYVVMKYLDNLIAWGDSLFLADTIETLNEATLCYVLAAQILGPRPQSVPQPGGTTPRNFLQLKQAGLDAMADAMVTIEGQFPFNLVPGPAQPGAAAPRGRTRAARCSASGARCTSPSRRTRTCSATGTPSPTGSSRSATARTSRASCSSFPLFDPPIDPGMLVKAAAAGLDIGSIVSGINQPVGPVRSPLLIQKALEIAGGGPLARQRAAVRLREGRRASSSRSSGRTTRSRSSR